MAEQLLRYVKGGVELPELGLWLDPHGPKRAPAMSFVSHAHADHIGNHDYVIASEGTMRLMRSRLAGDRVEHSLPFRAPAHLQGSGDPFTLSLFPAGHVLGSAMSFIESEGGSLLYTGDFKLRSGISAESCEPVRADVLIMETTFGRPVYSFPPTCDILDGVTRFCRDALGNDETPVLLGYSLGKSQEVLRGLSDANLPVTLHPQVAKMTRVYEALGQTFPDYEVADRRGSGKGRVWICPPSASREFFSGIGRVRTAVLTGWAVDPGCCFRYRADAAFPLSDHADFPDLIEFVRRVAPKKVYTLHGFAADFAQTLRELGYNAQAMSQPEQLGFLLQIESRRVPRRRTADLAESSPGSSPTVPHVLKSRLDARGKLAEDDGSWQFGAFASACEAVRECSGKLEKIGVLADFLRSLRADDLIRVVVWFTGLPFAPILSKPLMLGGAQFRDALCDATGAHPAEYRATYLKHSDSGETACELLGKKLRGTGEEPAFGLSFACVATLFDRLFHASGPREKRPVLADALARCRPVEGKYLLKILTGNLRIGLKEGWVEEALATSFGVPLRSVQRAHLLLGDLGEVAMHALGGTVDQTGLVPLWPLKCMLASPEATADAVWKRVSGFGDADADLPVRAWVEDKYDGVRCQLHRRGDRVRLFTRELKDMSDTFPELTRGAVLLRADAVLDGEVIGWRDGRPLPFAQLQKRLGRAEEDFFLSAEIPVRFKAFDLLWMDGETLLDLPLAVRRERLEGLQPLPEALSLAEFRLVSTVREIEDAFEAARSRGHEGLMIKDPGSLYVPGRRGREWIKFKKALAGH